MNLRRKKNPMKPLLINLMNRNPTPSPGYEDKLPYVTGKVKEKVKLSL
jgi:hypothetical protein